MTLQQWCKYSDHRTDEPLLQICFQHFGSDLNAFTQGIFNIVFQILDGLAIVHPHPVFKMMNKTAVVQIDSSDHIALTF